MGRLAINPADLAPRDPAQIAAIRARLRGMTPPTPRARLAPAVAAPCAPAAIPPCATPAPSASEAEWPARLEDACPAVALHYIGDDGGVDLKLRRARIVEAVSHASGVDAAAIMSARRRLDVARARQVAVWLAGRWSHLSSSQIGRLFDRDHSTVLYARGRVDACLAAAGATIADDMTIDDAARIALAAIHGSPVGPPRVAPRWVRDVAAADRPAALEAGWFEAQTPARGASPCGEGVARMEWRCACGRAPITPKWRAA